VYVPRVEKRVEFHVRFLVERHAGTGGVPVEEMRDPAYARPSKLTSPDGRLRAIASELAAGDPAKLALRLCTWVNKSLPYKFGVTNVGTSASEALTLGFGVCQDHAHLMIALARLAGMPARYVSGHLLGEGAMHAWVEVLAPDPERERGWAVQAWDPSHGRRCRPDYITVAVGRDYADVAPTSGSYTADFPGQLSSSKRAGITRVEYAA
jgi:transglutaminase-like putative cysteine protease